MLLLGPLLLCTALASGAATGVDDRVEVVVELDGRPVSGRVPALRAPAERALAAQQAAFERRLREVVPQARVRWRYRLVLNGVAVVLPARELPRLAALAGVRRVHRSVSYPVALDAGPGVIGAPALWAASAGGGRGIRIAIVDDGIDPSHRFFRADGLEAPDGFPKGQRRYTNGRIIVARAFPPPGIDDPASRLPFDPERSEHGTHVAGIAAGAAGTVLAAGAGRPQLVLSGVAPFAQLGNYRALTVDTASGVGLNGNSPELVAAIEAAVRDGMDVINLSLGQAEIDPSRDIVAQALDAAAELGVVPVVAAGNDFGELGTGSLASPGSSTRAITVAAVSGDRAFGTRLVLSGTDVPAELATLGIVELAAADRALPRHATLLASEPAAADPSLCSRAGLARTAFAGAVVVVPDGGCSAQRKAAVAAAAGAAGLVLASSRVAALDAVLHDLATPVAALPDPAGGALIAYLRMRDGGAEARFPGTPAVVTIGGAGVLAGFSAAGPTPLGLTLKPDVAAPGVEVISSLPGGFGTLSGTSMATPHVAGAVALLLQRHPDWTPEQVKSALVSTGRPVRARAGLARLASPLRAGGGLVDLDAAVRPLLFASPASVSFGVSAPAAGTLSKSVVLADAGGGAGEWSVSSVVLAAPQGVTLSFPQRVAVPGSLTLSASIAPGAASGDLHGWLLLEREGVSRRIPFWLAVARPRLGEVPSTPLRRDGTYTADSRGSRSLVERYRYPLPPGSPLLRGPERAFRVRIDRPVANIGIAVVSHDPGVAVTPRIVLGTDENRLAGATALPFVGNPYLASFGERRPVAAVLQPAAGRYTVVFDSRDAARAGRFSFRFWVDDTTPPSVRLAGRTVRGGTLTVSISDAGAGVDPNSLLYALDDGPLIPVDAWSPDAGVATLELSDVPPGRYRLTVAASDRQEAKNTENAGAILPNTRVLETEIVVPG